MDNKFTFTKQDTLLYKGIGILLIVIHNYLHWQKGFGIENEDHFNANNVQVFLHNLYPVVWTDTFSAIFGFLGHYGVQIFIFFSAYGLSIQFSNSKLNFSYPKYLFTRLKKLYFLLFFGVISFLIFYFLIHGKFYGKIYTIKQLFYLSTSISNFSHSTLYSMFVGPFWFFGLMVQLYIIFPLIYFFNKKYGSLLSILLSFVLIYSLYYLDLNTSFSLFGTIIGHLPEVILGIYFALNPNKKTSIYILPISVIVFCLSQFNLYFFPTSFLAITIILIFIIENIKLYFNSFWLNVFYYFGSISMTLFVVNGFFRLVPLFNIKDYVLRGERLFLYLLLLFIVTHFLHLVYSFLIHKLKI